MNILLHKNYITDRGAIILSKAFKKIKTLTDVYIELSENKIDPKLLKEISDSFKK